MKIFIEDELGNWVEQNFTPEKLAKLSEKDQNELKHKRCRGIRSAGYWRGYQCGTSPQYKDINGRWWCKQHLPLK